MGRKDKKTLIVISDGGDNVSTAIVERGYEYGPEFARYHLHYRRLFGRRSRQKSRLLKRLAEVSGGEFYQPSKFEDIVPVCKIAKDIRTRYTIGYIPNLEGSKKVRHIKVNVSAPDHGKLIARTRTSYMANQENMQSADRSK